MQEVLVDRGELVEQDLVQVTDDVDVALHAVAPVRLAGRAAVGAPGSRSLRGVGLGIKLATVEHLARTRLAGPAAGRHARARLQLLERARALEDGLLQAVFGNAVTDANVHMGTSWTG
jgi:hypothetical protein